MNGLTLVRWTLLGIATAALPPAHAATLKDIRQTGVLHLATEANYPPFNYYDKGKTLTGFGVELGNAIARTMGLKPKWTAIVFDSLLIGLDQNKYDVVIASHGITPERQKAVNFSTLTTAAAASSCPCPEGRRPSKTSTARSCPWASTRPTCSTRSDFPASSRSRRSPRPTISSPPCSPAVPTP